MTSKAERLAQDMQDKGAGLPEIIATLARVLSARESSDWLDREMEKKRKAKDAKGE